MNSTREPDVADEGSVPASIFEIGYDHLSPCADCPFLRRTKRREHDIVSMVKLFINEMRGNRPAFTCHKTDPRAKGFFKPGYQGELKHCAGLLYSAKGQFQTMEEAAKAGLLDLERVKRGRRDIIPWSSVVRIVWMYGEHLKVKKAERELAEL